MGIFQKLLALAGILSFSVALFQGVITFSPEWSQYFGAPEILVSNLPLLYAAGLIAGLLFLVFCLYAMSGAGYVRPLPMLKWGLLAIACVYLLRGLAFIPILLIVWGYLPSSPIPETGLASALVSLIIGMIYLVGTIGSWKRLRSATQA